MTPDWPSYLTGARSEGGEVPCPGERELHSRTSGSSSSAIPEMAAAAASDGIRARAQAARFSEPGTALALTTRGRDRALYTDLRMLAMGTESSAAGARILEIFLDRMVWTAATQSALASEYLLDNRYSTGLSGPDAALRNLLAAMANSAGAQAKSSSGWKHVTDCLRSLGADDALIGSLSRD